MVLPPPPPPPPPLLSALTVTPPVLTPNGDGLGDQAEVTYTLGASGFVTATLVDGLGETVSTLVSLHQNAGGQAFPFAPTGIAPGSTSWS